MSAGIDCATGIVCVGGGRGVRFGRDKLRESLGGESVFRRSLKTLANACSDSHIVAVVPPEHLGYWGAELQISACEVEVIAGGERRQDSVRNGIERLHSSGAEVALIHDAARPLIQAEDIRTVLEALAHHDGAILCSAVNDTVKQVDEQGDVLRTINRETLRMAQTPQVFRIKVLLEAWAVAEGDSEWTDEGAMLESLGKSVTTVLAVHTNPKITTPADLEMVRALDRELS